MSQHWYDTDGKPAYEIIGANGKLRDTTLRDARKFQYSPSTTTVIGGAAKPGLDNYLQQQLLQACLSTGMSLAGKSVDEWKRQVVAQSKVHSQGAAKSGTAIHDALEQYYLTGKIKKGDSPMIKTHRMVDEIEGIVITENVYYSWKEALTPVRLGLDIPEAKCYNLFISTQVPGLLNLTESTDFERDWGMFEALLKLWQLRNNYVPKLS